MINEYDEILQVFKDYLNEKSLLDLTTIAINCNLPYFLSKLRCTKDNFILTIDKKINDLSQNDCIFRQLMIRYS